MVNYVSHFLTLHNPKPCLWPQFRQSLLSGWVFLWQSQLCCPFGLLSGTAGSQDWNLPYMSHKEISLKVFLTFVSGGDVMGRSN